MELELFRSLYLEDLLTLHYSYMELELKYLLFQQIVFLLHYSYMELELIFWVGTFQYPFYYYIIPIWNWSSDCAYRYIPAFFNYIIPIWNWSY